MVAKKCAQCGNEFNVKASAAPRRSCCSRKCKHKLQSKANACLVCGKLNKRAGRVYCSNKCSGIDKRHTAEQFWEKVDMSPGQRECWPWTGTKTRKWYGAAKLNGKTISAHRCAWTVTYGAIPSGLCVLHRCDNPPCCNPDHLWLGTVADNNRDKEEKGRSGNWRLRGRKAHPNSVSRGTSCNFAKLNEAQVKEIRLALKNNESTLQLASKYQVSGSLIYMIKNENIWSHVK